MDAATRRSSGGSAGGGAHGADPPPRAGSGWRVKLIVACAVGVGGTLLWRTMLPAQQVAARAPPLPDEEADPLADAAEALGNPDLGRLRDPAASAAAADLGEDGLTPPGVAAPPIPLLGAGRRRRAPVPGQECAVAQQLSQSVCRLGHSFGCTASNQSMWATHGCRAEFWCFGDRVECDKHDPYNVCPCGEAAKILDRQIPPVTPEERASRTPEEVHSLERARRHSFIGPGSGMYDLSYTVGMPECHPRCALPELEWRVEGPEGARRDQFGTLLQWDLSQWGEKTYPTRVACLMAVDPRKREAWAIIADTWGRHCDGIYFVFNSDLYPKVMPYEDKRWNFFLVPMKRPDNEIGGRNRKKVNFWEKVWKMWRRASTELAERYDWFYKGDSDTWASIPNLKRFVQWYNPDNAVYFGHTLMKRWSSENAVFNSGCGYVLSRGALRRVGHVLRHIRTTQLPQAWPSHCVDRPGAGEDITFSFCLGAAGVRPMNSLDRNLRQRFLTFQPSDHFRRMPAPKVFYGDYYWHLKPPGIGHSEHCCTDEPVAFHNFKGPFFSRPNFMEMERRFGAPEGKPAQVPPRPQCFLFDERGAPLHDKHRNALHAAPPLQTVFVRAGELECARPDFTEYERLTVKSGAGGCDLENQLSSSSCDKGWSFGCFEHNSTMYVRKGCRGHFICAGQPTQCSSQDDKYTLCKCGGPEGGPAGGLPGPNGGPEGQPAGDIPGASDLPGAGAAMPLGDAEWSRPDPAAATAAVPERGADAAADTLPSGSSAESAEKPAAAAAGGCALTARLSHAMCTPGGSFGCFDGNASMWTRDGCRGRFVCMGQAVECNEHQPFNVCRCGEAPGADARPDP